MRPPTFKNVVTPMLMMIVKGVMMFFFVWNNIFWKIECVSQLIQKNLKKNDCYKKRYIFETSSETLFKYWHDRAKPFAKPNLNIKFVSVYLFEEQSVKDRHGLPGSGLVGPDWYGYRLYGKKNCSIRDDKKIIYSQILLLEILHKTAEKIIDRKLAPLRFGSHAMKPKTLHHSLTSSLWE